MVRHLANRAYILGTNHVDRRYVPIVQKLLVRLKPEVVGVELCRTRAGYKHLAAGAEDDADDDDLRDEAEAPEWRQPQHPAAAQRSEFRFRLIPEEWRRSAIGEKLGLLYAYGAIRYAESKSFRVQLQQYRQLRTYKLRAATRVDERMAIGAELLAPFRNYLWRSDGADSDYLSNSCTRYKILLLDRPVQQTYALMAQALTDEQKAVVRRYKENFEREFVSHRQQNRRPIVAALMLSRDTELYEIFVRQRDEYMARAIFGALVRDNVRRMFCVVGRTHVNGVLEALKERFAKSVAGR